MVSFQDIENRAQHGAGYIPEIQGLRGVAVLLVILFHAGVFLPGGYIGVDMFFVISGFVITKLFIREIEIGTPKIIRRFFLGRFYRLLPASAAVVLFTLLFSTIALSPLDGIQSVTSISRHAAFFVGNIGLLHSGGYFFSINPLEHLWSLGVEAQFYVAYPIVFLCLHKFSRRWERASLIFSCLLMCMIFGSLFFATVGAKQLSEIFRITPRDFSFYMMPSRSWEFLMGAMVAIVPENKKVKASTGKLIMLLAGVAILAGSAFYFHAQNSFPSFLSLLPALGTSLVIGLYMQSSVVVACLRSRLLTFIGNISYSLYLWHWPFIVFSKALFPNLQFAAPFFAVASLAPAWLSYRFIEKKIRFKKNIKLRQITSVVLCAIVLPISASYAIDGLTINLRKYIQDAPALEDLRFSVRNQCQHVIQMNTDKCYRKEVNSNNEAVLFGDSHASSASDGIVGAAKIARFSLGVVSFDGCPPFPISAIGDGCSEARVVYEQTLEILSPNTVVLVNSLEHYLQYDGGKIDSAFIVGSLSRYVETLTSRNIRVVIVLQVPNMKINGQVSVLRPRLSTSESNLTDQKDRFSLLRQLRDKVGGNPLVSFVETDELFCSNGACNPRFNDELIYRDQSHLNPVGSMRLANPTALALQHGK